MLLRKIFHSRIVYLYPRVLIGTSRLLWKPEKVQGWGVGTGDRNLDKSCNGFVASGS